jgi:hypothetical protein
MDISPIWLHNAVNVWDILVAGGYMVWYGMVWYGNRIIFIAKVLKKLYTKTKMQRFSKNHTKKQRCKGSQKTIRKNKDAKVLKYHYKNTLTKKKTNSCIFTLFNIYNYIYKNHTKKQRCKGSQIPL